MVQSAWKTVWRVLKKLKIELPHGPEIPLLGIYPKELKAETRTDICTLMLIAASFPTAKRLKQPKCTSTNEWIDKIWYIHTMEYYSALKRFKILKGLKGLTYLKRFKK